MKRKLSILLAVFMLFGVLILLASCGTPDKDTDTSTQTTEKTDNTEPEHKHIKEIIPAVAPTCTETGLAEGEKCSECGEVLVEQETLNKTLHTYVDSYTCTVCGEIAKESQGLLYDFTDETKTAYSVVGIGTCVDNNIIIPYTYNGLPVIRVSSGAFEECTNITSVTLSNNIVLIEDYAFGNCYGMVRIVIGTGVEDLLFTAFLGCTKLVEIYDLSKNPLTLENAQMSLQGYGGVFTRHRHGGPYDLMAVHSSIDTPSLITEQDDFMFITKDNKNYLLGYKGSAIDVTLPRTYKDKPYYMFKYAFSNCTITENISIPDSITSIGEYAFSFCTSLKEITIPNNVTSIGNRAFECCSSLVNATIGNNVTSIGKEAFKECTSLENVTIGNNVTSIGKEAFKECNSLAYITIPNNVTTIEESAFYGCVLLEEVIIPDSVTSIGNYVFYNCTSLTNVTFENTNGWYATRSGGSISGTNMDTTNASANAVCFTDTYYNYYWYKK